MQGLRLRYKAPKTPGIWPGVARQTGCDTNVFELTIRLAASIQSQASLDKGFESLTVEEVEKLQRRTAGLLGADLPLTHG